MNRAIRRIPLQHQAAAPLRIVRIVLDHDGRRDPGDDVANLYIVRGQLLGSVERDSYFVVPTSVWMRSRVLVMSAIATSHATDPAVRIDPRQVPPRIAYNDYR